MARGRKIGTKVIEKVRLTVTCLNCGVFFGAKRSTRKYCSDYCSHVYWYPPKGPTGVNVKCHACEKVVYIPRHQLTKSGRQFCSSKHYWDWKKTTKFTFPCEICTKSVRVSPFWRNKRMRKTCSRNCSKLLARRKSTQRKIENPTEYEKIQKKRRTWESREWRKLVLARDNHKCTSCGALEKLEVDHIKPFTFFPELRYDVSNGRVLCAPCHRKTFIPYNEMRQLYTKPLDT